MKKNEMIDYKLQIEIGREIKVVQTRIQNNIDKYFPNVTYKGKIALLKECEKNVGGYISKLIMEVEDE